MSDYKPVKDALAAGTPPEMVCAACPWDRLCITPPQMTSADVDKLIAEAKTPAADGRDPDKGGGALVATLMTALVFAGKDTAAQVCPVFALKLKSPDGRQVADGIRVSMRGEP